MSAAQAGSRLVYFHTHVRPLGHGLTVFLECAIAATWLELHPVTRPPAGRVQVQVPGAASQAFAGDIAFFKMASITPPAGKAEPAPVNAARNLSIRAWTQDKDLDDKLKAQAAKVTCC